MNVRERQAEEVGREAYALVERLYPFCRSLTGEGVRQTLRVLQDYVPLTIHEVPSGTRAYDWEVPSEWSVRDAYVLDGRGRRVIDVRSSNLHLVGYSAPMNARVSRATLFAHLHSDPAHPDWVPYRHSYYREDWGFCVQHRLLGELNEPEYQVCIDSTIAAGSLTYGEVVIPGSQSGEILISTHTCHPSLCNDNLSGIAVATMLALHLARSPRRFGLRFVFVPATLGPLVWLSRNQDLHPVIKGGLVIAGVGDPGTPTYMKSRRGNATIDRAVAHVFDHAARGASVRAFAPLGYDLRQYCSPGFDLPMGCFMRTPNGEYAEYHSSADNLQFVTAEALGDSWRVMRLALDVLENDRSYANQFPKGEPHLRRHGFASKSISAALFWALNLSDGQHSLLDIAERAQIPFWQLLEEVRSLEGCGLLKEIQGT